MYLKKIMISGFKSFADKISLNLDKGITGVVGPNGSGKSNIIDSVRWVMGEQNAKNLRGEKATDIIFAGSEKRKPLGAAEVSLVFDNSDEDSFCPPEYRHEQEITLTRRIFASGEREYLINKKECRFKDLVNFFAATGLGGRSYSMIQQGQVERILNAKPEDVREILEEAAGTAVYKKRKFEAEKKLEVTRLNLSRIDDILVEVEGQLKGLEGQVAKAREHADLNENLKEREISLFAHNFVHFKEQLDRYSKSLETDTVQEVEYLGVIASLESRHVELQSELDENDPEIQILQEQITRIREKIATSEAQIKSSALRLGAGAKRLLELKKEIEEDDLNLKNLESQVDEAHRSFVEAEQAAKMLSEAIESFDYEVESATEAAQVYQSRMEEFQDEIRNIERLIESNKFKSEQCERDIKRLSQELEKKIQKESSLDEGVSQLESDLEELKSKAQITQAGLDQEIKLKHEHETSVASLYRLVKESQDKRDLLREKFHESNARLKSLQELEKGATNIAATMKQLQESMEGQDIYSRLGGLLAHKIAFNSRAAELPKHLCSVFEQWTERLVIKDLRTLSDLVRLSHKQTLGAIPVLLTLGLPTSEAEKNRAVAWAKKYSLEPMTKFVDIAADQSDLSEVFGSIFILTGISIESDLLVEMPANATLFTAQGVVLGDRHDMLIGGHGEGGILTRKIEVNRLSTELKALQEQIARSQGELDRYEVDISYNREIIASVDKKLQGQNQEVLGVMTQLESIKQVYDHRIAERRTLEAETKGLRDQILQITQEKQNLEVSRVELQRELSSAQNELDNIRYESESLIERREEIKRQHESRRMDFVKSSSKAQAQKDSYRNLKAQLDLLQNKLSRRYNESVQIENDLESAKEEQDQSHQSIEGYLKERERLESEFAQKREATAEVIEETRVIEGRLKDLRDKLNSVQKSLSEKKIHKERASIALLGVKDQAQDKYQLQLDDYIFERQQDFDHDSEQKAIAKLRQKLESLGAVNMMAVREFEEKKERKCFIERQKDEVLSSIDLLVAAIAEIEDTSVKKFLETYEKVNREFGELFPILFPTGEGRLELTQPDIPLTSGVEIMCRLPGKSKKPMSLFSGGEKALTAISLIFALLKTKPTPFCFLDEVDAPLDEANVGRYNRVLEALSNQFQFIVITHNRRTMEVLDTLYGITMQEPGVSKVVGVDMQKDLPSHLKKAFKDEKNLDSAKRAGAVAQQ